MSGWTSIRNYIWVTDHIYQKLLSRTLTHTPTRPTAVRGPLEWSVNFQNLFLGRFVAKRLSRSSWLFDVWLYLGRGRGMTGACNDVSATESPDEDLGPAETDCSRKGRTGKQGLLVGAGSMKRLSTEHILGPLFTSCYAVACLRTGNVVWPSAAKRVCTLFPMRRSSQRFLFRGRCARIWLKSV